MLVPELPNVTYIKMLMYSEAHRQWVLGRALAYNSWLGTQLLAFF